MKNIIGPITAPIYGMTLALMIILPVMLGLGIPQAIEARYAPIVSFDNVDSSNPVRTEIAVTTKDTYRDNDIACFRLRITKIHTADVVAYTFVAKGDSDKKIDGFTTIFPYLVNDKRQEIDEPLRTHAISKHWERYYCFNIDAIGTTDKQPILVTGHATHYRHIIYDSITYIPPITIPALKEIHNQN